MPVNVKIKQWSSLQSNSLHNCALYFTSFNTWQFQSLVGGFCLWISSYDTMWRFGFHCLSSETFFMGACRIHCRLLHVWRTSTSLSRAGSDYKGNWLIRICIFAGSLLHMCNDIVCSLSSTMYCTVYMIARCELEFLLKATPVLALCGMCGFWTWFQGILCTECYANNPCCFIQPSG